MFNHRTARIIDSWRAEIGSAHLIHKVLHAVFKAAQTERCPPGKVGSAILAKIREFRDSLWWEVVKQEPYRKRRRLGLSQWKPGQTHNFEDIMVSFVGVDWRTRRDGCSKAVWRELSLAYIDTICEEWGFPLDPRPRPTSQFRTIPATSQPFSATPVDVQADFVELRHQDDEVWLTDRPRFRCIVDNQTLAGIINGEACLDDDRCRPVIRSISQRILHLVEHHQLLPFRNWANPVQWRPREYNKRADLMCNLILDGRDSFEIRGENIDIVLGLKPHILAQTDGGCRYQGTTALGYVIYGIIFGYGEEPPDYYTLAVGGARITGDLPSLESEARALDLALCRLNHFLASHELGQSS